ncbi:Transposon TX1 uncharacterized 149 kDa protein [Linum grandiflorum]
MTLLAWNCRELGGTLINDTLHHLNTRLRPRLLFLCETKSSTVGVVPLFRSLGYQDNNYYIINCNDTYAGGLALAWHSNLTSTIVASDTYFIAIKAEVVSGYFILLIGVYLHSNYQIRSEQFQVLEVLIRNSRLPFIIFGDFNIVTTSSEKSGGLPICPLPVHKFRTFINDLGLVDIGFTGPPFTWSNRSHTPSSVIECRLDRFLISPEVLSNFETAKVHHLTDVGSDHRAISLQLSPPVTAHHHSTFRFGNRWLSNPEVMEIVSSSWAEPVEGSHMFTLHTKLKRLRHSLHSWSRNGTSNYAWKIQQLRSSIDHLRNISPPPWNEISTLEEELSASCAHEAAYWRIKSRNDWILPGDRNTSFFHCTTIINRHFNHIGPLASVDGSVITSEEGKAAEAVNFYTSLFQSQATSASPSNEFPSLGPVRVINDMNLALTRPFSDNDIRKAVFAIGSTKSPGSDGFTAGFYQHFWHIIGQNVCSAIRAFFHSSRMLRSINHTWLTLIPKVAGASSLSQLRPIGLCQMPYKIIAKLMAGRLATVLPLIVSETQNGFVQNREISDNVLIAHEVMHYLKRKKKGKSYFIALKLDMEKAYDRVEWPYLFTLMRS